MMDRGEELAKLAVAGGVKAKEVTHDRMHVWLVEHEELLGPVAEGEGHVLGVIGEVRGDVPVRPAATVLKRLRKVPVVEAEPRRDAAGPQAVDDAIVEIKAGPRGPAAAVRLDPRPGDGEAVRAHAQLRKQVEIGLPAVVVVGCDGPVAAVGDAPRDRSESIPDALSSAAHGRGALDLVGGGRNSPY